MGKTAAAPSAAAYLRIMTLVLLLCLAVAAVSVIWSTHRHRQLAAWDKELSAATGERPEIPRHRSL